VRGKEKRHIRLFPDRQRAIARTSLFSGFRGVPSIFAEVETTRGNRKTKQLSRARELTNVLANTEGKRFPLGSDVPIINFREGIPSRSLAGAFCGINVSFLFSVGGQMAR
jgi:hypothetical protein